MSKEQKLYDALKRIASYAPPEKLRRTSLRDYGLDGDEEIEMAYENVIQEAKNAIKGVRRPAAQGAKEKNTSNGVAYE